MSILQVWSPMGEYYGINIPVGIIVPYNDIAANIPAGWSQWTSGANRALVGHASVAGTTGGASSVTRESDTGTSNHSGNPYTGWISDPTPSSGGDIAVSYAGSHTHTTGIGYTPAIRNQVMMKSLQAFKRFPINTGILSSATLTGLTDITPTGYTLVGTSDASSSSIAASSLLNSVNTMGAHSHITGTGTNNGTGIALATLYNQGASSHSGTVSVTDNIYRYYMGMWTSASNAMSIIPGMYALWESATPPAGWSICNGTNGTPDLTNYHIGMDSGAAMGTKTGNGTITTSGSLTANGSHSHNGASASRNTVRTAYHATAVTHTHSVGALASAFAPLNRTIIFIKATG